MITQTIDPASDLLLIPAGIKLPTGRHRDRLAVFLALLLELTASTPQTRWRGHYVNIHSFTRRQLLGHRTDNELLEFCKTQGWIEHNKAYSSGFKIDGGEKVQTGEPFTQSFRLSRKYRTGLTQEVAVKGHHAKRGYRKCVEPDPANLGKAGMFWFERLTSIGLSEKALDDPDLQDPWTKLTASKLIQNTHIASRCDFRRLHTWWTQAAKRTRKYWKTPSSDPLGMADISECQPLILYALATRPPSDPTSPRTTPKGGLYPYVARYGKNDLEFWRELCEAKQLYRFLFGEVEKLDGPQIVVYWSKTAKRMKQKDLKRMTLKEFKRECLIPIFDRLASMFANPVFKLIQRHFPSIAEFCIKAKSKAYVVRGRTIKHQILACMLQRFESETIIDDCGSELSRTHHDQPMLTVHDCITAPMRIIDSVADVMRGSFERFGIRPLIVPEQIESSPCVKA